MRTQADRGAPFQALHTRPGAFIVPNPWDAGTARLLASLGFEALATTSLGLASSLGPPDGAGAVTRTEVLDGGARPDRAHIRMAAVGPSDMARGDEHLYASLA